jgi:hypothetical protein
MEKASPNSAPIVSKFLASAGRPVFLIFSLRAARGETQDAYALADESTTSELSPLDVCSGSDSDFLAALAHVRYSAHSGSRGALSPCLKSAMCGRLRVGKENLTSRRWSVQPCVRPVSAVRMTAGHNALRGSGPGQKRAFDNAVALVGCPDRRIDRLCITCCSSSQPSHHARYPARSRSRRERGWFLVVVAPGHHGPRHPGELVGKRDCRHLGWPARQQRGKPGRCLVPWILA